MMAAVRVARVLVAFALYLASVAWMLWASTLSAFTIFAYLGGMREWNVQVAYATSLIGLIPLLGGFIASFMAHAVERWGFFHAAFNLMGYLIPFVVGGLISPTRGSSA